MARPYEALNQQLMPVSFTGGLDTKTAKQLVMPGQFLVLENCVRLQGSQIAKRYGFQSLGKSVLGGGTITQGSKLAVFRDDLLLMTNNKIYSYTSADDSWIDKGQVVSILVDSEPVIRNAAIQSSYDMASADGITVTVYEDSRGGSRVCVTDDETGSSVLYDQVLNSLALNPKVCVVGSFFIIAYMTSAGNLCTRRVPLANPTILEAEKVLITGAVTYTEAMDMVSVPSIEAAFIAYVTTTPQIAYGYIAETGELGSPAVNGLPNVKTIAYAGVETLTVNADANRNLVYVLYTNGSLDYVVHCLSSTVDFITQYSSTIEDLGMAPAAVSLGTTLRSNGQLSIYYTIPGSPVNQSFIRKNSLTWDGVSTPTVGTPSQLVRSVALATKPFTVNDVDYINCAYQSQLQSTYFTIQDNGFITARMQPGLGAGVPPKSLLARVSSDVTDDYVFPLAVVSQLQANADLTVSSANVGVNKTTLEFGSASYNNDILGLNQHISGGIMLAYDGVSAPELGFHIYPEDVTLTVATGTATFPSVGQWSYRVIYEWVDGKGQIHRSVPSTLQFATTAATTDQISIVIPTLRLTTKEIGRDPVKIVIYRSDVDLDTVLYRIATLNNDQTVDTITYVDANQDGAGFTSNEILYTTGGVLENTAPPASKVVHKHKNRLFIGGLENGNVINFTKEHVDGEGVSFSDALQIVIDPLGGDVTALSTLDDKLVIFKKDNMFIVYGDGPVDTGAQNDYTVPQLVSSDVGTSVPESVIITPLGIMFQSDKGIYLLDRQLNTQYVGAPVQSFNGETVTSAAIIDSKNEIRFTTESGQALIYNYFFNQWSTFTNYSAESAVLALSTYLHLKSDGTVNAEKSGYYEDNGSRIKMAIETGWFSFAGVQGYQRVYWLSVLGDFLSHCITSVKLAYNFEDVYNQPRYFDTRTGLLRDTYGDSTYGSETPMAGHSSGVYQFRIKPKQGKCSAMKVRIEDIDTIGLNGSASFNLTHMSFVVGMKPGSHRLRSSKTIGT